MNLPELFTQRIKQELGESESQRLFEALDADVATSIRYNPYKCQDIPQDNPIGWSKWGRYLDNRPSFTTDSHFHAGEYYVQEASSQFVGHILEGEDIQGCRLLDMCAAPGGKTTLYSTLVGSEGLVVANDIDRGRLSALADNVRKWGIGNVAVSCNQPSQFAELGEWFDVVAVDAPCSGEGMFRRGDTAREEWSESNICLCAQRGKDILASAWSALKCGGVLIYSTCTFNRDENEGVLEWFSKEYGDETEPYQDVDIDSDWGITRGSVSDFQTFRFFPHKVKGEGLFVAVLRKAGVDRGKKSRIKYRKNIILPLDKQSIKECEKWVKEPLSVRFSMIADKIYLHSAVCLEQVRHLSESLNIIYSGVAMGQIFKGKLKPDHALALYHNLERENISCTTLADNNILEYLRKSNIEATLFSEGMNLVIAEGAAVGFAKRVGNRVNNLYPNSLRILR